MLLLSARKCTINASDAGILMREAVEPSEACMRGRSDGSPGCNKRSSGIIKTKKVTGSQTSAAGMASMCAISRP